MTDAWDLKARFYDRIREYWPLKRILQLELSNIQSLLKQTGPITGPILDVGCGTGTVSKILPLQRHITGIDKSMRMLNHCRKKSYDFLIQAGAQQLPFYDSCFNLVIAVGVMEYFRDPAAVLQTIGHIIKPGGYFLYTISPSGWFGSLRKLGGIPLFFHTTETMIENTDMTFIASEKCFSQTVMLFQKRL